MGIDFRNSLKGFGTPSFEAILTRQLGENAISIPTERACSGGMPEEVKIIAVKNIEDDSTAIYATISVGFIERMSGGCGGMLQTIPRWIECRVTIGKTDGFGKVEAIETDLPDEF